MAERNFANRTLYHGDNLDSLRGMNSSTVNLIVTDPPFNKSRDFHATPDSLSSGAQFQDRWSWRDDIHGVVTPSGPAATGWWGCSRRMRKRSIGRSHRTRCRQHPLNPAGGLVDAAEGGYRVAGRWDFSSGCDPESRVMLICNTPEGPVLLMLPSTDCRIDDTWFVVGLRGSGSKDVVVDGAFVPRHRAVSMNDVREGCTPGRAIHGAPNYRIPMRSILSFTLSASVLGMAQGWLDVFSETIQGRVSGRTGGKFAESVGLQLRLAEADAELRAAQALLKRDCAEIFAKARDSRSFTLEEWTRYRRDQSYNARLSVQAIDRVFAASGGRALFESHPLQRFHQDVHAASHHVSLARDAPAEQFGKVRLGLGLERPDL